MSICGIVVSEAQGNINWEELKEQGVQFAIIRAGYGTDTIDLQFRKNAEGCNRVGIPCGVYWLSFAYTPEMARREAKNCIETIEEYRITYPVCISYEEASARYARSRGVDVTDEDIAEIIRAFLTRVEELGYIAMYFGTPF